MINRTFDSNIAIVEYQNLLGYDQTQTSALRILSALSALKIGAVEEVRTVVQDNENIGF